MRFRRKRKTRRRRPWKSLDSVLYFLAKRVTVEAIVTAFPLFVRTQEGMYKKVVAVFCASKYVAEGESNAHRPTPEQYNAALELGELLARNQFKIISTSEKPV